MRYRVRALTIATVGLSSLVLWGCGDDDGAATTDFASTTAGAVNTSVSPATATTAAAEGAAYTSPDGYMVVFPSEPSEQTQRQPLPDGSTMDVNIVGLELSDRFLATASGTYPEGTELDVPAALQGAQDQALANVEGTLISSNDIELQGRPGREFSASLEIEGEAGTLLQRVYLDGITIHQVVVTGAGELAFTDPDVAAFLESYQFVEG